MDVGCFLDTNMQEFLESLSRAYDKIDYYEFLRVTGFVDSDYALQKFKLFQQSARGLLSFDTETLTAILGEQETVTK